MSGYDISMVVICPVADLATVNQACVAMGWTDHEFRIPLSYTGNAPATHYATHIVSRSEIAEQIQDSGVADLVTISTIPLVPGAGATHFNLMLEAYGLIRITTA